tara:strand:- start:100 stop:333 length:234 start_codon:yes stop_codon:yes gene_type:complete
MVAGSMQAMMKKMPFGGGGSISDEQLRDGEQKLKRFGAFVELMSVPPVESAVLAVPQLAASAAWLLCVLRAGPSGST